MVALSTNKILNAITGLIAQPATLNRLVDCTTNHTGTAVIKDLNLTVNLGDDNITTTNFTLRNISISGLDTFNALRLLQPGVGPSPDAHRGTVFTSKIGLDRLGLQVRTYVQDGRRSVGSGNVLPLLL